MVTAPKSGIRIAGRTYRDGDAVPDKYRKVFETPARPRDPARRVSGAAPNFGRPIIPHVMTYSGLLNTLSKAYRYHDEALRHSVENAHMMLNDMMIAGPLFARQRMVSLLNWSIESEDDKDKELKQAAEELTNIIEKTNRFTEYRRCLSEAIWYGRSAVINQYAIKTDRFGHARRVIDDWQPVSGDKLLFRYYDQTGQYDPTGVGVRVNNALVAQDRIAGNRQVEPTSEGLAYFFEPWERKSIVLHKHMIRDGEYEDPLSAGQIHGVGIRHFLYWAWYQKQETLAQLMEIVERTGMGITLYYYPSGNEQARAEMENVAKQQAHTNVLLIPHEFDNPDGHRVEVIPPNTAGIDALMRVISEYFEQQIVKFILGQTLSTTSAATGLGSGVADLHQDSLQQIIRYDAINLEETLTKEMLLPLRDFNMKKYRNVEFRLRLATESKIPQEEIQAIFQAWQMGAKIKQSDLLDRIGVTAPQPDDEILQNPQIQMGLQQVEQMQQQAQQIPMGNDGAAAGGNPFIDGVQDKEEEEPKQNRKEGEPERYARLKSMPGQGDLFGGGNPAGKQGGLGFTGSTPSAAKLPEVGVPQEGDRRVNRAGNEEELRGGRWHLTQEKQQTQRSLFEPSSEEKVEAQPDGVKQPWEMTRQEFLDSRGANAEPERDDFARYHLSKVGEGEPGISVEGDKIVYRTEKGIPVGVTTMRVAGGQKVVDDTGVHPDYRRQGIATALYREAMKHGHDTGWSENIASGGVKHKIAVEDALAAGHPVPDEVLREYPDLYPTEPLEPTGLTGSEQPESVQRQTEEAAKQPTDLFGNPIAPEKPAPKPSEFETKAAKQATMFEGLMDSPGQRNFLEEGVETVDNRHETPKWAEVPERESRDIPVSDKSLETTLGDSTLKTIGEWFEGGRNEVGSLSGLGVDVKHPLSLDDQELILFHAGELGNDRIESILRDRGLLVSGETATAGKFLVSLQSAVKTASNAAIREKIAPQLKGARSASFRAKDGKMLLLHPATRADRESEWQLTTVGHDGKPSGHTNPPSFEEGVHRALGVSDDHYWNEHGYELEKIVRPNEPTGERDTSHKTDPTPDEIAQRATELRKGWSDSERSKRETDPVVAQNTVDKFGYEKDGEPEHYKKEALASAADRVHLTPSEAQIEAGNYRKGHIHLHGLNIAIENPKGSKRREEWPELSAHYGDIKRTSGADSESLDVFIGPEPESEIVYVIDQCTKAGKFDEHKVVLGVTSKKQAKQLYLANYPSGWKCGPVTAMTIGQFRAWLDTGNTKKPVHRQVSKYAKNPWEMPEVPKTPSATNPTQPALPNSGPRKGETKVIDGVSYTLNENSRWERTNEDEGNHITDAKENASAEDAKSIVDKARQMDSDTQELPSEREPNEPEPETDPITEESLDDWSIGDDLNQIPDGTEIDGWVKKGDKWSKKNVLGGEQLSSEEFAERVPPESLCGAMGEKNAAPRSEANMTGGQPGIQKDSTPKESVEPTEQEQRSQEWRQKAWDRNRGPKERKKLEDRWESERQKDREDHPANNPNAGMKKEIPKAAVESLNKLPVGSRVGSWEKVDQFGTQSIWKDTASPDGRSTSSEGVASEVSPEDISGVSSGQSSDPGKVTPEQQESIDSAASLFGVSSSRDNTQFVLTAAKRLGYEGSSPADAAKHLHNNAKALQANIDIAKAYGFKGSAGGLITRSREAAKFLVNKATKSGYESTSENPLDDLHGALVHLSKQSRQEPDAHPDFRGILRAISSLSGGSPAIRFMVSAVIGFVAIKSLLAAQRRILNSKIETARREWEKLRDDPPGEVNVLSEQRAWNKYQKLKELADD